MSVCKIQGEPNFFHVCQSVSWLTCLLKFDKYRDISSSGWDIFLKYFGEIPGMFLHYFQIFLIFFMFVSLLVGLLSHWNYTNQRISPVPDETSSWYFWRHSWDVGILVPNNFNFHVSVSLLLGLLPYWNLEI